jgi:hypothetical protein
MGVHPGSKRNLHRTFLLNPVSITHIPELRGPNVQTIKGLIAEGPDPELKDKLMLFGQFVGDWEIECESLQSDGKWVKSKGEVHFGWSSGLGTLPSPEGLLQILLGSLRHAPKAGPYQRSS